MTDERKVPRFRGLVEAMDPEASRAWRESALAQAKAVGRELGERFAKLLDEARAAREAKEGER